MSNKIVQVDMDDTLLEALDSASKQEGRTRAELIREACQRYLRRSEDARLEQAYEEGYNRIPEEPMIGQAQVELSAQVLPEENW